MYLRKSEQIHRAALFKWLVMNRRKGLAKRKNNISQPLWTKVIKGIHRNIRRNSVFSRRLLWKSSSVRFIDKASRDECAHTAHSFKVDFHKTKALYKGKAFHNFDSFPSNRFFHGSTKSYYIVNIIAISNRIKGIKRSLILPREYRYSINSLRIFLATEL